MADKLVSRRWTEAARGSELRQEWVTKTQWHDETDLRQRGQSQDSHVRKTLSDKVKDVIRRIQNKVHCSANDMYVNFWGNLARK